MWLTAGYPWAGDPVGSIFLQTQAQALAGLGVPVAVVAPTPLVAVAAWSAESAMEALLNVASLDVGRQRPGDSTALRQRPR